MDKKDILYMVGALGIILIIALVIKPIVTGQPVNTGIATPQPTVRPVVLPNTTQQIITQVTTIPPTVFTPTPLPTWDKNVSSVVFVDPSAYGISFNQSLPGGTRIDTIPENKSLTTIAKIAGQFSGTTQIMNIPFPYWELWYTVDPFADMGGKAQSLSSSTVTGSKQSGSKGSGSSQSVIQGSFSVTNPTFSIQVMDADDPNRIIRTITPPGGLDKALWSGVTVEGDYSGSTKIPDPRPWKEKFFEGQKNYFFVINTHAINSYSVEIRVPSQYIK